MFWVVTASVTVVVAAALAPLYIIFGVYKGSIGRFWGYAPNHFFFLLVAFPLAAFCTFAALRSLLMHLRGNPSPEPGVNWVADNWVAMMLVCVMLATVVTGIDYFSSTKSFDKLRPEYARKALQAVEVLRERMAQAPPAERGEFAAKMVREAQKRLQQFQFPSPREDGRMLTALLNLDFDVYLQVAQDPKLQRQFGMLQPTVHALTTLGLLAAMFTAWCAVFAAVLCYHCMRMATGTQGAPPDVMGAYNSLFLSVCFFASYPIAYAIARSQIDPFLAGNVTVLPHLFSGIAVGIVLLVLIGLDPHRNDWYHVLATRLLPLAIIVVGLAVPFWRPELPRQILGADTTLGIQLMIMALFLVVDVLVIWHVWPPRHAATASDVSPVSLTARDG